MVCPQVKLHRVAHIETSSEYEISVFKTVKLNSNHAEVNSDIKLIFNIVYFFIAFSNSRLQHFLGCQEYVYQSNPSTCSLGFIYLVKIDQRGISYGLFTES